MCFVYQFLRMVFTSSDKSRDFWCGDDDEDDDDDDDDDMPERLPLTEARRFGEGSTFSFGVIDDAESHE